MKKRILFVLTFVMLYFVGWSQVEDWRIHPNKAKYYIKGVFDNSSTYTLTDVETGGITIHDLQKSYTGEYQNDHDDVLFTFDHVETTCPTKYDYISYWVFDDEINEWIPDVEIRSADRGIEHRKIMTVMLVLDCSSSLENEFVHDFKYVKEGALTFLRSMYNAAKAGNIRIGIIGFNSLKRTQIRQIEAINEESYGEMVKFINNFDVANGTAFYYSLDNAINMLNADVKGLKSADTYTTPIIVSFTDGLDQTSFDNEKGIRSADSYYTMVEELLKNNDIEHFVIPFKGSDITSNAQKEKFERVLRGLTKPDDNTHYLPVKSMSELSTIFGGLADNLVERWQILRCYVAPARQGKVCWTFGKKSKEVIQTPTQQSTPDGRNIFLGFNATAGLPMSILNYDEFDDNGYYRRKHSFGIGLSLKLGIDFAWPLSNKFAIGAYINGGPNLMFNKPIGFDVKAGLLMLAGDLNNDPFIIGIAPCTGFTKAGGSFLPFELRLGKVISHRFYITGNLNLGIGCDYYSSFMIEPSVTFGVHLGNKLKTRGK